MCQHKCERKRRSESNDWLFLQVLIGCAAASLPVIILATFVAGLLGINKELVQNVAMWACSTVGAFVTIFAVTKKAEEEERLNRLLDGVPSRNEN